MPRFGVLSFGGTGHINPLICLARRLMARGHSVVFFHSPEIADIVRGQGLEFISIGNRPPHSHAEQATPSQRPEGIAGVRYRLHRVASDLDMFLREAPAAIRDADVDALVLDEIALAGPTVAQMLAVDHEIGTTVIAKRKGFLSRESAPGSDHSWLAIVRWESAADAEASMEGFASEPLAAKFMALIEPDSLAMKLYAR